MQENVFNGERSLPGLQEEGTEVTERPPVRISTRHKGVSGPARATQKVRSSWSPKRWELIESGAPKIINGASEPIHKQEN